MINFIRKHFNFSRPVFVRGRKFQIPIWGGVEALGITFTKKTEIISRYANSNGIFVDVGVNLGQTLIDVRLTHPGLNYVGFEPNPLCVSYLRKLIEVNRFEKCTIIPAALSDRNGLLPLYSASAIQSTDSASTLIEGLRSNQTSQQFVTTIIFDSFFVDIAPSLSICFVKIDVEGAELEVLMGMQKSLEKYRPVVYCEVLPQIGGRNLVETESRGKIMLDLLHRLEFRIYHVESYSTKSRKLKLTPVEQFIGGAYSREKSWDYLFVPKEKSYDINTGEFELTS